MYKITFTRIIRTIPLLIFLIIFVASNKVTVSKYTPYTILAWEIKANEGYRDWWYPDGTFLVNGKRKKSFSVGFGWNDLGGTRRHEISKYTADGRVSYGEALQITLYELSKYPKFHNDPYKNLAMQLHSYNCGLITSPKQLRTCHNGKDAWNKRCGHWCKLNGKMGHRCANVRKSHNTRREFELALWKHDWIKIQERTEDNQKRVIAILRRLKRK